MDINKDSGNYCVYKHVSPSEKFIKLGLAYYEEGDKIEN